MRAAVFSITLTSFLLGCDGSTDAGRLGRFDPPVPTRAQPAPVDDMLTFDAGALAGSAESADAAVIRGVPDENLVPPMRLPGIQLEGNATSGSCGGSARACAQRGISECALGDGCERARSCLGESPRCLDPGLGEDACARAGCTWAEHCEGEATPCGYLNDDECNTQPGCSFHAR